MATNDASEHDDVFHLESGIPVFNARLNEVERKQAEAETRDEGYKQEQLRIDRRVMYFTGALVVCSILSALVSGYQAHVARLNATAAAENAAAAKGMVGEMKKTGTDTHALAEAAGKQATNTDKLATAAGRQANAMKIQAENTKESLRQSDEAFRISEQPIIILGRKDSLVAEFKDPKTQLGVGSYFTSKMLAIFRRSVSV